MGTPEGHGPSRGQRRRAVTRRERQAGEVGHSLRAGDGVALSRCGVIGTSPSWVREGGQSDSRTFFLKSGHFPSL